MRQCAGNCSETVAMPVDNRFESHNNRYDLIKWEEDITAEGGQDWQTL